MGVYVKPIRPTPTLSGKDAKRIIEEALTTPSPEAIEHNKQKLKIRKNIMKK